MSLSHTLKKLKTETEEAKKENEDVSHKVAANKEEIQKVEFDIDMTYSPSEHNIYADIEAVYKYMEENYGAKKEDIILYGQSVGSGRTLDLASRLPRLRDVVLHSPILSGLRVMYHVKRTYCLNEDCSWAIQNGPTRNPVYITAEEFSTFDQSLANIQNNREKKKELAKLEVIDCGEPLDEALIDLTCGRPELMSRQHIWTLEITQSMLCAPEPLRLPNCAMTHVNACDQHMTILRIFGPPLQWNVVVIDGGIGHKYVVQPWYQFLADNDFSHNDEEAHNGYKLCTTLRISSGEFRPKLLSPLPRIMS
ncbi:hypothetical protein JHK87_039849 [Glycine soja]|nr:hypothetical protein JHK87_039849 [Glycine soja]